MYKNDPQTTSTCSTCKNDIGKVRRFIKIKHFCGECRRIVEILRTRRKKKLNKMKLTIEIDFEVRGVKPIVKEFESMNEAIKFIKEINNDYEYGEEIK